MPLYVALKMKKQHQSFGYQHMTAQVVTIAQQKGGAGKTTTAAHLAVAWAQYGLRVAILDVDPQASLAHWYQIRKNHQDNVVPLTFRQSTGYQLQADIARLKADHDFIIVDSPPHTDKEARNAIRFCDLVIIPMQPSPLDLWATQATLKIARQEKKPVKMLLNRVNPKAKLSQKMQQELKDLSLSLFGNRVVYAGSLLAGKGVTEVAGDSAAGREMFQLAEDLLEYFDYEVEEEDLVEVRA